MTNLTGYADPLTAKAGGTISFMLSASEPQTAQIKLVRIVHGDTNPLGPGFVSRPVESNLPLEIEVVHQPVLSGSYAYSAASPALAGHEAGTLFAFICPTMPGGAVQGIAGCWDQDAGQGYLLDVEEGGRLRFRLGGEGAIERSMTLERPLVPHCWYFVAARWDVAAGTMSLHQISRINRWNSRIGPVAPFDLDDSVSARCDIQVVPASSSCFTIAAAAGGNTAATGLYNGKIDRPGLFDRSVSDDELSMISSGELPTTDGLAAYWDTTVGYTDQGIGDLISDVGPHNLHAQGVNRPIRGMTGWNWAGKADSFRIDPAQYGGIAFHDDALVDCCWRACVSYKIPDELPSGVYALHVRTSNDEDYIPFFVSAAQPRAKIAVLIPTFTYLAYANEGLSFAAPIAQAICANTPVVSANDIHWQEKAEYGLSTYDVHSDYSGVCYSSSRRPILNMRPKYRMPAAGVPWAFAADLSLLWWLEHAGFDYEILTDHDLDRDGVDALAPYRTVLTSTHPEYYSGTMLDATEDYLCTGGRVCYLGGNGYYWVTSVRPDEPWCIEVRKLDSGSRAWQAAPGEAYLASSGERSGLWRARGRAPQKIVGLGFTTEGMDESRPFERMPDSFAPENSWIFEGLGGDEKIGDFGLALGGASGIEMDRYDLSLGTPPHAMLLAASFDHSDNYPLVSEDVGYAFPGRGGTQDPQVRGDMIYYSTPKGGAVFSVGSIAWSQALPCKDGNNNVARIMSNVLNAFISDTIT